MNSANPWEETTWKVVQIDWHSHGYATVVLVNVKYQFINATAENVPSEGLLERLSGSDRQTTLARLMGRE